MKNSWRDIERGRLKDKFLYKKFKEGFRNIVIKKMIEIREINIKRLGFKIKQRFRQGENIDIDRERFYVKKRLRKQIDIKSNKNGKEK